MVIEHLAPVRHEQTHVVEVKIGLASQLRTRPEAAAEGPSSCPVPGAGQLTASPPC
jgi:hypothetical protein